MNRTTNIALTIGTLAASIVLIIEGIHWWCFSAIGRNNGITA